MTADGLWDPEELAAIGSSSHCSRGYSKAGRLVSLLTIGTAGAAVAGAFLPWVVYNRGGGNGTVRLSGVHASAIGALVVVAGVVMAVGGLLSVLAPDNQRGRVLALSSAAGFLVCFSALYQHADLGGVGPVAQTGPGWILATGSFGCTLAAAIAIWLTDVWQRQMEPREPSHNARTGLR